MGVSSWPMIHSNWTSSLRGHTAVFSPRGMFFRMDDEGKVFSGGDMQRPRLRVAGILRPINFEPSKNIENTSSDVRSPAKLQRKYSIPKWRNGMVLLTDLHRSIKFCGRLIKMGMHTRGFVISIWISCDLSSEIVKYCTELDMKTLMT